MSGMIYTDKDESIRLFFSQCQRATEMTEQLISEYKPMLINRRFVTDAQLSQRLNISRRTLQDYRDKGRLPFYRFDGKILYEESEVEDFLLSLYRPKFDD